MDRIEITTIVDNFSDVLLPGSETVTRPPLAREGCMHNTTLLAEHGLCLLIKVYTGEQTHSILLDTGYTNVAVPLLDCNDYVIQNKLACKWDKKINRCGAIHYV